MLLTMGGLNVRYVPEVDILEKALRWLMKIGLSSAININVIINRLCDGSQLAKEPSRTCLEWYIHYQSWLHLF